MDIDDWKRYLTKVFPGASAQGAITVETLTGGVVNSTIRASLPADIVRSAAPEGFTVENPSSLSHLASNPSHTDTSIASIADLDTSPTPAAPSARTSFVLKYAPAHMPGEPDTPLSRFRQTAEARALSYIAEDASLASAVADTGLLVPRLVWHDVAAHVLWISDLGPMRTLTDYLASASTSVSAPEKVDSVPSHATRVGLRLGDALARLHTAALSPSPELRQHFKDPAPVGPGISGYLRDMTRKILVADGHSEAEADALAGRIGLDVSLPAEDGVAVWGISDLWPGSVLIGDEAKQSDSHTNTTDSSLSSNGKNGSNLPPPRSTASPLSPIPRSPPLALVDWEFATADHPGSEIGMLLAHLRGHALRAAFPKEDAPISHITEITESGTVRPAASASGSASTTATLAELNFSEQLGPGTLNKLQQERQRRVNVNDVSQAFVAAYCAGAPELVHAPSFLRMALQAYGREMIVAAEFERDAWSPEGRRQSVVEGAAALGAAGTRDSDAEAASKRAVIAISDGQRERGVAQEYQYQDLDQSPLGYISLLLSARQGVES